MLTIDNLWLILLAIPVYQMMFYTVQLFSVSRRNPSRRYLGLLMLSMTVFLIANIWKILGQPIGSMLAHLAFFPLLLIIAPFFYLFVISLADRNQHPPVKKRLLVYFPAIIVLVIHLSAFFVFPSGTRENYNNISSNRFPEISNLLLWTTGMGFLCVQLVLASIQIHPFISRSKRKALETLHSMVYFHPQWLLAMGLGVLAFILSGVVINVFFSDKGPQTISLINLVMLAGGGISGHYGLKMDNLFRQVAWMDQQKINGNAPEISIAKHENGRVKVPDNSAFISPDETESIRQSLEELMQKQKPYTNCSFNMGDLCVLLDANKRKVTYVINEVMQKNFYAVVNEYRVKESMELLCSPDSDKYKMESIAEMAGFSSKSTFYACFRKYTNMTPSEYKESVSASEK